MSQWILFSPIVTLSVFWYERPHTSALARSDLLKEVINIEDEQTHLASAEKWPMMYLDNKCFKRYLT